MPMGYSFNLDGSMMYCTFATLFIAQAYDIHLSLGTQITMLLILMLTSKGMAGVPRASLVVIAATLNQFDIPEAGLLLILGVDTFLDMGRSATMPWATPSPPPWWPNGRASCCRKPRPPPTRRGWMKNSRPVRRAPRKPESRSKETVMASRTVWKPLLAFCAAGALLTGPAGAQESDASSCPTPRASRSRP